MSIRKTEINKGDALICLSYSDVFYDKAFVVANIYYSEKKGIKARLGEWSGNYTTDLELTKLA